jgi:hypothetical protein
MIMHMKKISFGAVILTLMVLVSSCGPRSEWIQGTWKLDAKHMGLFVSNRAVWVVTSDEIRSYTQPGWDGTALGAVGPTSTTGDKSSDVSINSGPATVAKYRVVNSTGKECVIELLSGDELLVTDEDLAVIKMKIKSATKVTLRKDGDGIVMEREFSGLASFGNMALFGKPEGGKYSKRFRKI